MADEPKVVRIETSQGRVNTRNPYDLERTKLDKANVDGWLFVSICLSSFTIYRFTVLFLKGFQPVWGNGIWGVLSVVWAVGLAIGLFCFKWRRWTEASFFLSAAVSAAMGWIFALI